MIEKELGKENFVHHIHHKEEDESYRREVTINGAVYSIGLGSNDPDENMDYLTSKSMEILKQLIKEGK